MMPTPADVDDTAPKIKEEEIAFNATVPAPAQPESFSDADPEQEREEAFEADHFFMGKKLHGFSISRDALWHRLRAGWPALPPMSDDEYAEQPLEVAQPEAWIALFLCAHTPDDWAEYRHDTKRFIAKIESWIDNNIATREDQIDAVTLGLKIKRQARVNLASARASGHSSGK